MLLDKSVRFVNLQFSFSNPDVLPESIRRKGVRKDWAKDWGTEPHRGDANGTQFIQETPNCSLKEFIMELGSSGYELVDAFNQERINKKRDSYYVTRFVFSRSEYARTSPEFRAMHQVIKDELWKICNEALWQVRAYNNPYHTDADTSSQRFLSINMETRQPLYLPDGRPVVAREKDKNGVKIGDPVPLSPKHQLAITVDKEIVLISLGAQ